MQPDRKSFFTPLTCQLIIFLTGLLVMAAVVFLTGPEKYSFGDSSDYLNLAGKLLTENVYPRGQGTFPFFRAPLYPFFIYSVWLIFPQSILAVKLAQCILLAVTSVLLFRLASMLFNNMWVAFLAGLAYCFNPFVALQVSDIQTEPLHTLLVVCGVILLLRSYRTGKLWLFFLTGITWGLGALCRPSAWPIALAMFGFIFLLNIKKLGFGRAFLQPVVAVLGLVLAIAPWTLDNYRQTGEFIVINDASGFNIWFGNHPELMKFYDGSTNTPETYSRHMKYMTNDLGKPGVMQNQIDEFERTNGYYSLKLKDREKLWRDDAIRFLTEDPSRTATLFGYKLWDYWRPFLQPNAYPNYQVYISLLFFSVLYIFAFIGGMVLFKKKDGRFYVAFILAFFLASTGLHVIILAMIRYRMPYIEPYLTVLAAGGFWWAACALKQRLRPEKAAAALS
ncbi:MAG TPA: glycosyltransferase family 39 protein [Pyrinomonadaceae bacterium]|jgi:4-amino-4-deoxy-L-arabinose transferase-like glycosyltransferase|nr:glycosyltransferase family 39 protein [Pyrinomonadaceae bacterium]